MSPELKELNIKEIHPNPYQPRLNFDPVELSELAQSIIENGLIQPIIVRKSPILGYELIAGERRFRACQLAGLEKIPAIIKELSNDESMKQSIIENLQRADLNPIEEAKAYQNLIQKMELTHDEVATYMGKSRPYITNSLRLLNLPATIKKSLEQAEISQGHARLLLSLDSEEKQLEAFQTILKSNYTVKQLHKFLKTPQTSYKASNIFISEQEKLISQSLGLPVTISLTQSKSGTVKINFANLDDFNRIIDKLN
ncbi:ParB/RepB/Spo0J family partition protein [Streptococcus caprae]|uniref:ParB/RepB/Spo0J family partition protein n=1 Tax=Streptococcus caprae TaxID=1640501 RepID=A0ABV8CVC9_9STRE